jgi:hypothetical protein
MGVGWLLSRGRSDNPGFRNRTQDVQSREEFDS